MWKNNLKKVISALILVLLVGAVGYFVYKSEPRLNKNFENERAFFKDHPFRLGLDLSGGSHLVYLADVSGIPSGDVEDSMSALRDVIEKRVNLFGVSEAIVQVQGGGFISGGKNKLIVDLPGITDTEKAKKIIGQTPLLEFKVESRKTEPQKVKVGADGKLELGTIDLNPQFQSTDLTGKYLKKATLDFNPTTREPIINLQFDDAGAKLFEKITGENIGKPLAIFLDGQSILDTTGEGIIDSKDLYAPIVQAKLSGGQASITGKSTPLQARELVRNLNYGALPVPITNISTNTIGASLGENAINAGVRAAVIGFLLVVIFLIVWYRLPGLVASLSLSVFVILMLALFKLIPVTLTAAGIAGFIISIGIAVDANVLIFERVKEELKMGRTVTDALSVGFSRAWLAIRDSNTSNIITAIILFWFGTSLIKGFALTLGIGVVVSMFSAITVTRVFLRVVNFGDDGKMARFLFSSGISK